MPGPDRVHAVGIVESEGERHAAYWRSASLVDLTFTRQDLPGPAGEVPRTLALAGAGAFVQSTAANLWVVDGASVQFVDLASQAGGALQPLGVIADGGKVRVVARAGDEVHVWTWQGGSLARETLSVDSQASLEGDCAFLAGGSLLLAGTSGRRAALLEPLASTWSAWPLEPPAGYRAVYGATEGSGIAHLVGEAAKDDGSFSWATYWRFERSTLASTRTQLPSNETVEQGSIATSVALDGKDVYVAGVLLDCWERDASVPALWRVGEGGEGAATLTVLQAGTPWDEPWATSVRAWAGAAFVGGEDQRRASIWVVEEGQRQVFLDGTVVTDLQLF